MTTLSSCIMPLIVSEQLVTRILSMYGLHAAKLLPAAKGYRNTSVPVLLDNGQLVNLMLYKQEPAIDRTVRRADKVSNFVAERGLPARHTLDPRIVSIASTNGSRCARLYDYLPGETIPWEAYTRGHITELGATLGRLHSLLAAYDADNLPNVEAIYNTVIDRMMDYCTDPGVTSAMANKLSVSLPPQTFNIYRKLMATCQVLSNRQVLHMDFVRGNILFDGTHDSGLPRISGILDFEKTAIGHPLFDVARTLAFLLVDCKYKSSEQVTKYFLQSGYIKRGPVKLAKITVRINQSESHDLLALLLDFFLLHDFYKFLRHNPYESLASNEHYVRTRDMLLQRNILAHTQ